jgi:predicted Na+-dependent transporter
MLKKNGMPYGILIAFIFPVIAGVAAYLLKNNMYLNNKPALPYFTAIAFNLVLLRVFYKKEADKTVRGIMLVTFVFMLLTFIFIIHPIK